MDNQSENIKISRKELYDLVWSKPMSTLAKEYLISDNGLRKICKKFNIPLPQLGHWQKIQHNKKVNVIPLPKDFKGEDSITLSERIEEENKENEGIMKFHKLLKEISSDNSLSFKVSDKLSNPDKLISEAKENFASKSKEKHAT